MTTDGNGRYVYLDPRRGGMHAVAEAARNLVCVGARPLAVTDCLNYGNPEKPGVFYQFVQSIAGIAEACCALGAPVVSGNVSFYNETQGQDVFPTPIVGMVGVVDDLERMVTAALQMPGDLIVLLGGGSDVTTLGGSEYAAMRAGRALGPTPPIDLALEAGVQAVCLAAIREGHVRAAHDASDGGLAVALAEMCIAGDLGAAVKWDVVGRADAALFGEGASRILLELAPEEERAVRELAARHAVPCVALGHVTDDGELRIAVRREGAGQAGSGDVGTARATLAVTALRERWEGAIPWAMR